MHFTDTDRARFLHNGGYVTFPDNPDIQEKVDSFSDTELVDWAIKHKYVPAYWRQPKNESEMRQVDNTGQLIFVKEGDRERIDKCLE